MFPDSCISFFSMQKRVENFRLFYKKLNKRPLLGFFVGSEYPLYRYKAAKNLPTGRALKPDDFCVEEYVKDSEYLFNEHEACGGDFIWSGSAFWGIPWLEAALGCEIFADHSTGSIYSKPPSKFNGTDYIPEFDVSLPWIKKMVEFINALAEKSEGRWPIGTTRMRGISDLLSALYGGDKFIFAMMEEAKTVKKVCERLTNFWIKFGKLQLENIPLFFGGVGSFYYNMWAPKGTVWLQEDAAALLSPELFDTFIRPYDEKIVNSFEGCIIHQHPSGFLPLDDYLGMNVTALELHIDEGGPGAQRLYEKHIKILQYKPLLIWGNISSRDMDWIFSKLPPEGLAVCTVVSSPKEARELWAKYGRRGNK